MGSFPNSYLIVNSFQMFSQTVSAICFCRWRFLSDCCMAVKRSPVWMICAIIRSEERAVQRVKRLMPQKILIWVYCLHAETVWENIWKELTIR
jgi:hypothetical protein